MSSLPDYLFLIPVFVLFLSEIVKVFIESMKTGEWHQRLFRPGGMPSSHSAFVMSLLIVVGSKATMQSAEFAIAFCFACIVWYDAMTVRRQLGEQGKVLNTMQSLQHFAERMGHSFFEVLCGVAFGGVLTWLVIRSVGA